MLALLLLLCLIARPARADEPPETSLEGAVSTEESGSSEETTVPETTEEETETSEAETSEEPTQPSETTEEETTPEETTPEETTPEETTPEETTEPPIIVPTTPYSIPFRSYPVETMSAPVKLALLSGASTLNLRAAPNKNSEIVATVRRGVVLEVIRTENGWHRVGTGYVVDGREVIGYISGNYTRTQVINPGSNAYKDYLTFLGFPAAYQSYLVSLHQQYPNWVFIANPTGETWANAIANEVNRPTYPGMSLIHPESISSWKKASEGYYDYETSTYTKYDGNWNAASDELVAYFLDPRNFLNGTDIFQFLDQTYDPYQTVDAVRRIVSGTFLAASSVTDVDGTVFNYPAVLCAIGQQLRVSPMYLASVIKQEIGYETNPSITGKSAKYPGYYNYYNIYAYTTASESANDHGLWYASGSGVGATSYGRPWNTRIKALRGGAQYLADNYVLAGQNTLYFKKYNSSCDANNHFIHQFMTNVRGAYSEGRHLANGYDTVLRKLPLAFDIPIYNALPASPCPCPTGDGCINNRLKSITVGDYELFPDFDKDTLDYNVIITGNVPATVTLSAKAYHSTAKIEGTGTVTLKNGTTEYPIKVTAQNGDERVYTVSIYCENGTSSLMNPKYKIITGNRITGVSFGTKTDAFITDLGLGTGVTASLFNADGSAKKAGTEMKNGDTVKVFDPDKKLIFSGTVLLFGDVNGDGYLRMSDMIKVRNHILGTGTLTGINLAAADCNHDGNIRMSDMIKIRNEILGTGTIVQTGN